MTTDLPSPKKLWHHPDPKSTQIWWFMKEVEKRRAVRLETYKDLHTWSVDHRIDFWADLFALIPPIHHGKYQQVVDPRAPMDSIPKWFEGIKLNFAENVLFNCHPQDPSKQITQNKDDHKKALIEVREGAAEIRHVSWGELRQRVGLLSNAMRKHGVSIRDRVAVVSSNSVDTFCVFMAVTALGGIFSSSSTDMGTKGILDRLLQIKPKFVFVDDWAVYNGKTVDLRPKMKEVEAGVRDITEFEGLVFMSRFQDRPADVSDVPKSITLAEYLERAQGDTTLRFTRLDFGEPFLIVYSSGTTGVPKCIMHSIGGVLLSSTKEGRLHRDLGPSSVNLQYTTTGWIMYLSSLLTLQHSSTAVLYDGSPFLPNPHVLLHLVPRFGITDLGISPRYLQTLSTSPLPLPPKSSFSSLRRVSSTGMVLPTPLFHWFYATFPAHIQLANIAGGTDLAAAFALENPLIPVYDGGCPALGLGLKVEVYDATIEGENVTGRPLPDGEPGELVCTAGFPNQPAAFFGDHDDRRKYRAAYFERYTGVWTHGDFVYVHPRTAGVYFLGRADGVLNPSGVRFGSAEIYGVLERFFGEEVEDGICVGQRRKGDADERVMLFLKMKGPGAEVTPDLVRRVKERITRELSPRHVPAFVFQCWDIPTTVNLKKVELPVKRIVSGEQVKPSGTLLNPESLDFFYQFAEVEKLDGVKSKL
ncbi:Acetyl-coenzyme A synthetase [Sphaceloma murrayae]|uniref:Acetyl-coenzyme A synthetase n=1 Tax=Sphaceloma murrayae TaxID=2082308 RepID=A0A2K1QMT7_9PEZI|nr:Acetyl-coenzyme A synthetase [Sphaceloma murrayae]